MRTVGIKLADGSFYPIMEEGSAQKKTLELTTAHNNQTCVMVDLYRSKNCTMEDAEYIDTLKIENLNEHPNGEPSISFDVGLDENGELSASIADPETGATSNSEITLVSRTAEERLQADDYSIADGADGDANGIVADDADSDEGSGNGAAVAAGVVAGAGLMAAAAALASKKDDEEEPAPAEDMPVDDMPAEDDFTLGDPAPEEDATVAEDMPAEDMPAEDMPAEDMPAEDMPADDDFSLPGDDATITEASGFAEDAGFTEDATVVEETPADEDFSMPDDDFSMPDDATIAEETAPAEETPVDEASAEDDFSMPDDATIAEETAPAEDTLAEDDFSMPDGLIADSEPTPSPADGLNFTGLYDKETEMGESAPAEEDDIKKKTKAPVIICITCAIICIVATILVLLVLPTKFNLRQRHSDKKTATAVEKSVEPQTAAPVEEKKPDPVPQAKEDEVVVIEKAEDVKPVPPPAAEKKPAGVTYKIKWGDTLWDIADTYYKNPWRYKKIANYNNIKNPDHIISGTVITIPAE